MRPTATPDFRVAMGKFQLNANTLLLFAIVVEAAAVGEITCISEPTKWGIWEVAGVWVLLCELATPALSVVHLVKKEADSFMDDMGIKIIEYNLGSLACLE